MEADLDAAVPVSPDDDKEAQRLGNHYHYAPWMNNAEDESIAFTILYRPEIAD